MNCNSASTPYSRSTVIGHAFSEYTVLSLYFLLAAHRHRRHQEEEDQGGQRQHQDCNRQDCNRQDSRQDSRHDSHQEDHHQDNQEDGLVMTRAISQLATMLRGPELQRISVYTLSTKKTFLP